MAEEVIAVNDQTGERVAFRNGAWVPVGGGRGDRSNRVGWTRQNITFANDNDAIARTILAEAGNQNEQGQLSVGAVIANRAKRRNLTPTQVVLQENQFEPWGSADTTRRVMGIPSSDPRYVAALALAQRALAGEDPTRGADHFYAPKVMEERGGPPSWDNGKGWDIGDHRFFRLDDDGGPETGDEVSEGTKAVNDETGEVLVFTSGEWVPEAPTDSAAPAAGFDADGIQIANAPGLHTDTTSRWGTEKHPWTATTFQNAMADGDSSGPRVGDSIWYRKENGEPWLGKWSPHAAFVGDPIPQRGGATVAETGALQDIGAAVNAASEQLPFSNDLLAGYRAIGTGQSWREARQDISELKEADRATNQTARNIGGVAGFGIGLLAPGAGYVQRGATGVERMARAAQVGAGYGALYGSGTSDADTALGRLRAGGEGAALGGLSGGLLQGGIDRLARNQTAPASAARRLSREGVELTPGMMAQEIPVVGPVAKYAEDLASGYIPFIGGARERSAESLGRAVANRALAPIGEEADRTAKTGYELASGVYSKLGAAYDNVLPNVSAQADGGFGQDLTDIVNRAATELPQDHVNRLEKTLREGVIDRFTEGGVIDGETFKNIETRLRQQSERYNKPNATIDDNALADFMDETRDALRNLVARQNPAEAEAIADINRGYANYARMRRATRGSAQQSREGTFTPGELSNAVSQMSSEQQLATRSGLMQDLAVDARKILPSSMGDTGSGQRAGIATAVMGIGAGTGVVNPLIPAAILGGATLYSAPAQKALNAVYRATDSRVASEGLQTLLEMARRDPAMVPVYQSVLDDLTGASDQPPPVAAQPDVLNQAQAGMPVQ